jgi:hypothetical protein
MRDWKNWLIGCAIALAAWYGLKMYVGISLVRKFAACTAETKPATKPPYSEAQARENATRVIDCVDARTNVVERLFFHRDEVVANMKFETK